MRAQTERANRSEADQNSRSDTILGFAVLGLLGAGVVGVMKAMSMESGTGVGLCLLGSVAAFGTVAYIFLGKR